MRLLLSAASKRLIKTYHGLHLVKVIRNLGNLGIEQAALGLYDFQISAVASAGKEFFGILHVLLQHFNL